MDPTSTAIKMIREYYKQVYINRLKHLDKCINTITKISTRKMKKNIYIY